MVLYFFPGMLFMDIILFCLLFSVSVEISIGLFLNYSHLICKFRVLVVLSS